MNNAMKKKSEGHSTPCTKTDSSFFGLYSSKDKKIKIYGMNANRE